MSIKRASAFVLALALALVGVSAFEFNVVVDPPQTSTKLGEAAVYTLLISHDSGSAEKFDIYTPDVEWDLSTDIVRPISVARGETKEVRLSVRPLYASPGYYAFSIHIRHTTSGAIQKQTLIIGVNPKDYVPGQYVPALRLKPGIDDQVDPREPVTVTVDVQNANRRDLANISLKIRSTLLNTESKFSIVGLDKKQLVFPIKIPKDTPPQRDVLRITALVPDGDQILPFEAEPVEFEIIEYGEIASAVAEKARFLRTDWDYTLTNNGNALKTTEFKLKSGILQSWFTTSEPIAKKVELKDGTYDAWDVRLDVGEQTVIRVTTNYRPLLVVFFVFAVALAAYYLFRSPLVVRKSAVVIAAKEGGMSELKVLIEVANRSGRVVKNVIVLDKVPHIAEVIRDFEIGTMRPVKIAHDEKKGTLIKWVLEELDAGEERVITYKIRSKLSILGQMRLPVAVTKCETAPGRVRRTKSNLSQIGFGQ